MMLLGVMEITGRKITLPMIHLTIDLNKRHDPWSVYVLGIFSGITTSCCTPVLAGVLTVSFLSVNMLWAGLAGLSYVFGMVTPLVVLALMLEKVNWTTLPQFRTKTVRAFGKSILLTDYIAGILYIFVGILFSVLALTGRITMGMAQPLETSLGIFWGVARFIRSIPYGEYFFGALLITAIVILIQKERKQS